MSEYMHDIPDHVSKCLQLAVLLEVSAYPKPGNVHRTADFQGTSYEHFLASTVALMPHFGHVAEQGVQAFKRKIKLSQIGVGETIRNAITDVMDWQHGGNTLLGSVILLTPMAAAAGQTLADEKIFSVSRFRTNLKSICKSTTSVDAVNVYDAITSAQPGGLGRAPELDVTDATSKGEILKKGTSLYEVFKISSAWDSISAEWVSNYHITFDIGYPFLKLQLTQAKEANVATVHTYLKILSEVPDTLIIRKAGIDRAKWVSVQAKRILELGGLTTQKGKNALLSLDQKLHDADHKLNPGTTADITSATTAVATLNGYRP